MQSLKLLWVIIILVAALTGCQTAAAESVPEGRIKIGGSTSTEPVVTLLAKEFMKQNPNVEITVRGGGSSLGIKGVGYEGFHIGMASRPLNAKEKEQWPAMDTIPIARDGIAVVIDKTLYESGVRQLTYDQIASLWRGEYNNWTQLGSSTGLPVRVFDLESTSGTREEFIKIIFEGDEDPAIPDTFAHLATSEEVISAVANTQGAVSILPVGLQTDDVAGVPISGINGLLVAPTLENISNTSYPITRNLSLVVNGSPEGWEKEFIDFVLSPQGQQVVEDAGYRPISN